MMLSPSEFSLVSSNTTRLSVCDFVEKFEFIVSTFVILCFFYQAIDHFICFIMVLIISKPSGFSLRLGIWKVSKKLRKGWLIPNCRVSGLFF